MSTGHYLGVSLLLLCIGLGGMLLRRNLIIILMSLELILNAVNLNLVAFSQHWNHVTGQVFGIFVITVAVAEAAVGLALLIALYRNRGALLADEIRLLKW
ncbi:MAG: NADH-quinone oxidoreductase subunit NuoK [Bryobacter sp.]|nr:NADH-quinone oxidoreductase subunit NuoK [Bryobacter sp.]